MLNSTTNNPHQLKPGKILESMYQYIYHLYHLSTCNSTPSMVHIEIMRSVYNVQIFTHTHIYMDYNILQMSLKGVETSQDLCSV